MPKPRKRGIKRVCEAARYSGKGLRAAWKNEAAFRQECTLVLFLVPLAFWLGQSLVQELLLISSCFAVLVIELLNSAIEAVVDEVTDQYTELAGRAKDMGSAAVMLSLILVAIVWGGVIWERFFS